ncbi:thioredoxin [candidate division WOR-1 bacterium RIFOXYD2_FULL_36_8]|uniref:Thioredoxin n=1 Tax=candidate division WOR-1 bacterium RIFOXYB2_FULL_36_35 TaxID=1802578 RepID=A0A1F4S4X4_UNCSA|nr:MAG: thioredoxin [candidate division WOR-1 bacterium RIFOXYA2_FULL_36_21]OGC14506.1 MAG: thioredoxin [candidate division WOR-1 bacterium RIFOXYA12_FULL_36_13]OGC15485.1 MAG: thioredoxin [candidate division WOR-1 bacterium RIFOXYB2_FULL_36_35]OGC38284.1 MAG: thioredoxin [candidate division WOR-1 bacterium RIFOXYD2_FULL_36_8]
MSDIIKHINDSEFNVEVAQSQVPVLVDFWAPWCGPCQMLGPVLEKAAAKLEAKVKFVKINTDENQEMAAQLGVSGIPSLFIFKDGKMVSNKVGFIPQATLEEWLNKNI